MKISLLAILFLIVGGCNSADKKPDEKGKDASLETRLAEYIKINDEMNFEKMMDYIYPKLFTLAPRKEILKEIEKGFDNEEVKVELDSLKIEKLFPVFEVEKGSFARINYSMLMQMKFTETKDSPAGEQENTQLDMIRMSLGEKYGEENVSQDEKTGIIKIRMSSAMVAVKDDYAKEWSFISLKEDDPMIDKLFSKEVIEKLVSYQ